MSSAELFALSDSDLFLELLSRLQDKRYAVGLGGMSEAERVLHLLSELESEVANGGFDQYLLNSSGNCARSALAAARLLDARLGVLVARALAVFPNGTPDEDRATRSQQMRALPSAAEAWSKLESELDHDLSPLLQRYIRAHQNQFACPPQRPTP